MDLTDRWVEGMGLETVALDHEWSMPRSSTFRIEEDCTSYAGMLRIVSYHIAMNSELLRERLVSGRYGETASEVLDLCSLVLEADSSWTKEEISRFKKDVGINVQVWRRLLAIARDPRLKQRSRHLPGSYTALYAISSLSDEALEFGLGYRELNPQSSSRDVQRWATRWSLESSTERRITPIYLSSDKDLSDQQIATVLEELNKSAIEQGVLLTLAPTDSRSFKQKRERLLKAEIALSEMETDIEHFMYLAADEVADNYSVEDIDELFEGDFKTFAQSLLRISRSRVEMMDKFGVLYCYKVALEHFRADSRTQRFNYKRRLSHVASKYPHLRPTVETIRQTYFAKS
jgi:hypothetical protein